MPSACNFLNRPNLTVWSGPPHAQRWMHGATQHLLAQSPEIDDELLLSQAYRNCNMCTCSGNSIQERAVQDLLYLVDLYLVYLI